MLDNPLRRWLQGLRGKKGQPPVLVKELHERDRRRVLRHLLALDKDDRLLRFGSMMSDDGITAYVGKLNFERDIVFGVVSNVFQLVGMGHLAFAPTEGRTGTAKAQVAEFGVSVSSSARGQGVGTRLFQRAAIHCRNSDVDTLYMQCLTSNKTMMHIAKKAGMVVTREYGEADAHLELPPPSPGSVMAEALEEQFAAIDYTVKANTRAAVKFFTPRKPRQ